MNFTGASVFAELLAEPAWAVLESHLFAWFDAMREISAQPESARGRGRGGSPQSGGSSAIAVVPVNGVIVPRAGTWMEEEGWATSAETIGRQVRAAAADPAVHAIVLDVNSPGGAVAGVQDAAEAVLEARNRKRVEAVSNPLMASAAYWIASGAHRVTTQQHGYVGSIGALSVHFDQSEGMKKWGITATVTRSSEAKAEEMPYAPLSESAKTAIRERVNSMADAFVDHVARGRNTSSAAVRAGHELGRVLVGRRAIDAGLADDVGTLDQVLARLGAAKQGSSMSSASTDADDAAAIRELTRTITGGLAR